MNRVILATALCAPIAGLAVTLDPIGEESVTVTEIRVPASELRECRETLAALDDRPVVTDGGTVLPDFLADDGVPETVCVAEA